MINPFSFEHGEQLYVKADQITENILLLKKLMHKHHAPVLYINDNYGKWQSNFTQLVDEVASSEAIGAPIAQKLMPSTNDYSIIKPKYSGFFDTPLHLLLEHLGVKTLFLTGIVGNMCVQFTANDAYTLEYELCIPQDAVASFTDQDNHVAMHHFEHILKANVNPSSEWLKNKKSQA